MRLIKLQITFLWTKRVWTYLWGLSSLATVYGLLVSDVFASTSEQHFFKDTMNQQYLLDAITFIKWMALFSMLFILIHSVMVNQYDELMIARQTKELFILSKLIVMVLFLAYSMFLSALPLLIIGELTDYFNLTTTLILSFSMVFMISVYYLLFALLLYLKHPHIIAIMTPFLGYILSFILSDPIVQLDAIDNVLYLLHIGFPDVLLTETLHPLFLYGTGIVLSVCMVFILGIIKGYQYRPTKLKKR
ncbi:MAG: hypothetical protein K9L26_04815 [Candidatus Izimaplasma sp.]|nr:hypothetical protein [Candidatus Izimaplasma bacterium]